jgi:glycerol-3-phosphate dehydrogenase
MTRERNISAPILEHVYRLLWEGGSAKELAEGLMNLPMMEEMTGVSVGA